MFDIGWSELLLIAVVAVVVIGPKDLPTALRSLGRTIRGVRRMASDFQSQFNEALREAELDDLRKEVQDLRDTARGIVRDADVSAIARDELEGIRQSIDAKEDAIGAKTAEGEYADADAAAAYSSYETDPELEPELALEIPAEEPELPFGPPPLEQPSAATALAEALAPDPDPPETAAADAALEERRPVADEAQGEAPPRENAPPRPLAPRREPVAEPALMTQAAEPGRP